MKDDSIPLRSIYSDFIIDNGNGFDLPDGRYYHFGEVIRLIKLWEKRKLRPIHKITNNLNDRNMCYGCYEEAGKPAISNEKTKKAAELARKIYENDSCGAGGYAHVVTDDWNLDDENVDFSIKAAKDKEYERIPEKARQDCLTFLEFFKELTMDERASAMAMVDGFIDENGKEINF